MPENIDKTLLLSYARTGSTAVLDPYRVYLRHLKLFNNIDYIETPNEIMCYDSWAEPGHKYNFYDKFFQKHHLLEKKNSFISKKAIEFWSSNDPNKFKFFKYPQVDSELARAVFNGVLSEPFFAIKIFPNHINDDPAYMKEVLIDHVSRGNNLVCLYRRNVLDSLSSLISCLWHNTWVIPAVNKFKFSDITAEDVDIEKVLIDTQSQPLKQYLNEIKIWYDCYQSIKQECSNINLIAYEDIKTFDSDLLRELHGVELNR